MENKSTITKWTVVFFATLILALACAIALPQSAWAESESVTATDGSIDEKATLTSSDGAVTYTVIETTSSTSTPGKVMLASVSDAREGDYAICDEVSCQFSPTRKYTFDVVSVSQSAFRRASNITSLYIPATIEDTRSTYSRADSEPNLYLYGCTSLETVTVDESSELFSVQDNVLFSKDMSILVASAPNNEALNTDEGYIVPEQVRQVNDYAFYNCTSLKGVRFQGNLIPNNSSSAIGEYAFNSSTNLEWVEFPAIVGGIARYAFAGCTNLALVTSPDDCVIYDKIGLAAFSGCSSLEFISLPPILGGVRRSDYYFDYDTYYPFTSFHAQGNWTNIYSGYSGGLFGGSNIIEQPAINSDDVALFKDCTSLKAVVFKAGTSEGATSYTPRGNQFSGCTALESIVFEAANQPYYMDPNRAVAEGIYRDCWEGVEDIPTYYYAVDYYLTDNIDDIVAEGYPETEIPNADSDDIYVVADLMEQYFEAKDRFCRVEYARDTPTSAIATSDEEVLCEYMYGDTAQYAQTGYSDGVVPDPNEAAAQAGLDTSIEWVWKLTNTQSRRGMLTESCSAYLVPATDISAGHVLAEQIPVEYKLCDQNLSRGFLPNDDGNLVFSEDVAFDVARFYGGDNSYRFYGSTLVNIAEDETAWFTLGAHTESFYDEIEIVAGDGSILSPDDYEVSFQRYRSSYKQFFDCDLSDVNVASQTTPLLMTITPTAESGYTNTLREWVLILGHEGSVKSRFTDSPIDSRGTWNAAIYYQGWEFNTDKIDFDSGYTETISSDADNTTALLASSYAGLLKAKIEVYDGVGTSYEGGFRLSAGDNTNINFTPIEGESASERACAFYDGFEYYRGNLGATRDDYPWGNTAIVTTPDSLDTTLSAVASYSYAMCAPIFFTEEDNISLSKDTLTYLSDFDRVVVIGDETTYSAAAFSALKVYLGSNKEVIRISADAGSTCALTLAVADELVTTGVADFSFVSVIGGDDPFDILGALNFSGHEGGTTLVSTCSADTKRISEYLREHRDSTDTVRLFGRTDSEVNPIVTPFDLEGSLENLWGSDSSYETPVVGTGDTLNLWGVNFTIAGDDTAGWIIEPTSGYTQEGMPTIYAGTYYYAGTGYTLTQTINPVANTMSVYAGADRWQTANMIASSVAECAPFAGVIVCSGANGKFADALCASGLSGLLDYPVVLVNGSADSLDQSSAEAIEALLVNDQADIVILGGTSTVSVGIETDLLSLGNVIRVAGDDRYATAEAVYTYGSNRGSWSTDYAIVAIGNNFPDALGAASFCTTYAVPMLLTNQNSEEIESYVTDATTRVNDIIIVGGTTSIPDAKANTLGATTRMDGTDRYDTNLKFASWQIDHGMSLNGAGIATGTSFPDSLGSSYLLSLTKSVLLLSSPSDNSALYNLLGINASGIHAVSVLGGDASVPATTRTAIQTAIGGDWETINR